MAQRRSDKGPYFWSWLSWGLGLVGALVVGFAVAILSGEGAPTGLVFGGVTFMVLAWVLSRYLGPPADDEVVAVDHHHDHDHAHHHHGAHGHDHPGHDHAAHDHAAHDHEVHDHVPAQLYTAPEPEVVAPVRPVVAPAPAEGVISERVRDAARAAGEAARALGEPVAAAPVAAARPAWLDGPRAGGADDLKKIKGVGPKLEELLHSLGFYHFDQVAAWTAAELAWVDENLEGFHGRASRDEWVAQAKILAAGGETEFSRRVDKGEVY